MISVAAVVEGFGDIRAVPHLVAKTGALVGLPMNARNPIRAGEWPKLRNVGVLERYLDLALSRGCDQILVLLDLDDGCAAEQAALARDRVNGWKNGRSIPVSFVFIVREFESLFLACADNFASPSPSVAQLIADSETYRDAKGQVGRLIGRRYKETQDQEAFMKRIDLENLIRRSRSFRKLTKEITTLSYDQLDLLFPAN